MVENKKKEEKVEEKVEETLQQEGSEENQVEEEVVAAEEEMEGEETEEKKEKKPGLKEKIAKKMGVKDSSKKKIEKLEAELAQKSERVSELERSVATLVAENRNQKARLQKEFDLRVKYALEDFFKEFILIKDDFDKALSYFHEDQISDENKPLFEGIKHVNTNLEKAMEKSGLKGFDSVGEAFDPSLHQAMRMVDVEGKPQNEVVTEYCRGYKFHDRILRPAMVEVASGNDPEEKEEKPEEEK